MKKFTMTDKDIQELAESFLQPSPNTPKKEVVQLARVVCQLLADKQEAIEALHKIARLEKLARLGNGASYGNSIGNDIAKQALTKLRGEL